MEHKTFEHGKFVGVGSQWHPKPAKKHFLVSIDENTLRFLKEHFDVIEEQPGFTNEFFLWVMLAQHPDGQTQAPITFAGVSVRELTEAIVAANIALISWDTHKERPWEGRK